MIRILLNALFGLMLTPGAISDAPARVTEGDNALANVIARTIAEEAKLIASDAIAADRFGYSVSLDGGRALVGAHFGNTAAANDVGVAYIFVRSGNTWLEEAKLTASLPHSSPNSGNFGKSVSLFGDRALVGAPNDDVATGAAYIFVRSGSAWTEEVRLTASDGVQFDTFGGSVSLSGDRALIGARGDGRDFINELGAAYVYVRTGTSWSEEAKLIASDAKKQDSFGTSVSLDGDRALIGAIGVDLPSMNSAGAAYFFERDGTGWNERTRITASDASVSAFFGGVVSLDGNRALIGASNESGAKGAAYVFVGSGVQWSEESKLTASDGLSNDNFGNSVSLSGSYALIGSSNDATAAGSAAGSAYVFVRSGSAWNESEKLTAGDADGSEAFGASVSVDDGRALIGAQMEDLAGAGNAGAAYVFGVTPVSVEGESISRALRLDSPYPNPARDFLTVPYVLEKPTAARLALYDVIGREVAVRVIGAQVAGSYEATFFVGSLSPGLYVLHLSDGEMNSTRVLLITN